LGGLAIKNQAVQCAQKSVNALSGGTGDGLLGLAFDLINQVTPGPVPTPVQNLNTQGVTPKVSPLLNTLISSSGCGTFHLHAYSSHRGAWILHFWCRHKEMLLMEGHIDQAQLGGKTPFYTPIVGDSGFWKVSSVSIVVNGQTMARPGNTAICDTGTTLCLFDTNTCKAIYAPVPGAKSLPFPLLCRPTKSLTRSTC
jgi:Eukaryotic aspartyl protease